MNEFFNRLVVDPMAQLTLRQSLEWAMQNFYVFMLVLVRMSGLMTIGPVFGQSVVPGNVRILLVLTLSIMIAPTLNDHAQVLFSRYDQNGDGRLVHSEIPEQFDHRFQTLLEKANKPNDAFLTPSEFRHTVEIPSSLLDFAWVGISEFALGLVLGLGMMTILSGLQLAGEIVDQQAGIALGEISSPGLNITGSVTGQFFFLLGTIIMLVMKPIGGHLLIMSALVETFHTMPVGEAFISVAAIDLLRDLVHQSLVLGVQVAAPLLATMSLVGLTMGFLGHTVPQINVLIIGFPLRAITSLLILTLTFTGMSARIVDVIPTVIDDIRIAFTST